MESNESSNGALLKIICQFQKRRPTHNDLNKLAQQKDSEKNQGLVCVQHVKTSLRYEVSSHSYLADNLYKIFSESKNKNRIAQGKADPIEVYDLIYITSIYMLHEKTLPKNFLEERGLKGFFDKKLNDELEKKLEKLPTNKKLKKLQKDLQKIQTELEDICGEFGDFLSLKLLENLCKSRGILIDTTVEMIRSLQILDDSQQAKKVISRFKKKYPDLKTQKLLESVETYLRGNGFDLLKDAAHRLWDNARR